MTSNRASSFNTAFVLPPTDPIAAVTHVDPYPYYADLREGPPLVWSEPLRAWIASRAGVVESVLRMHGTLRVRPVTEPVPRAILRSPAGEVFGHLVRMNDGAVHAAHRAPLQRALAGLDGVAVYAEALAVARDVGNEAAAAMARPATNSISMSMSDALFAMPVRAVAHLLGFDRDALPQVERWMRDFTACLSPLSTEHALQSASIAAVELMARFEALVAGAVPRHATLLAAVQHESLAADVPTGRALLANLVGLLSQTCDATAGLLGNSLIALARAPEAPDLLRAARTREGRIAIVEETARHDPSVHNTRRFAAVPVRVAGAPVAAGDAVLLVLAAANRDAALNPEPDRFLLRRAERRSLGFGHGAHACPGQALACTLAAAGLEAWLEGLPDIAGTLRERGWAYRPSVNARIPVFG